MTRLPPYLSAGPFFLRTAGAVVLILLACLLYAPVMHAPFQFDDYDFILNNPSIRDLSDTAAIWNNLSQPSRFIPFYTFALNYHVHGFDVFGYHMVNVIIHILSAFCVWAIVSHAAGCVRDPQRQELFPPEAMGWIAALIFMVHPVQTQAVSYIAQRFASLAALFYLTSLLGYIRGREGMRAGHKIRAAAAFTVGAVAAVLGMFSKEFVMTLPLIILLYEWSFFQRTHRPDWRRFGRWMLAALPLLVIVPAIFSFRLQVLFSPRPSSSHHGDIVTLPGYLLAQLRVFAKFVQLLVFPVSQNVEYDFPLSRSVFEPAILASAALLVFLLWSGVRLWRRNRAAAFGIFWFFLSLSSHLVPRRYLIAEHKLYIASVGFCLAVVFLGAALIRRRSRYVAAISVLIGALAVTCYQRNLIWQDPVALWTDATRKSPAKPRAWLLLGQAYTEKGEWSAALDAFDRALALDATLARAYHNRGQVHAQLKDYPAALADYTAALRFNKRLPDIYNNRGNVLRHMREYRRALEDYAEAIRLDPDYPPAYNNRGIVYKKLKDYDRAIADFSTAIRLDPDYAVVYNNRGNLYYQLGRTQQALTDYDRAIFLSKERPLTAEGRNQLAVTHMNRALYYARRGEREQAIRDAREAQELGYAPAEQYLRNWKRRAAD